MLQRVVNGFFGFKYALVLFKAFKDSIKYSFHFNLLILKHYKIAKFFKKTFNCPIKYLKANYIYVGSSHLEISPFSGVLINGSHRLFDTFPRILAIDSRKDSLKDLALMLDSSFCPLTTQDFNYTKENIPTEYLFDSISLPFVLDRMVNSSMEIEEVILALKDILKPGGMIFGFCIANSKKSLSDNAKQYIKTKDWGSLNYSVKDLEHYLEKHFDQIGIVNIGDLTIFSASTKPELKNAEHMRPTLENTKGKKIRIPSNYTAKRFLDFRKPDLF